MPKAKATKAKINKCDYTRLKTLQSKGNHHCTNHLSGKLISKIYKEHTQFRDFPGGPLVKNLPCNAQGTGSIPGQGSKIPTCLRATEPTCHNQKVCVLQRDFMMQQRPRLPQRRLHRTKLKKRTHTIAKQKNPSNQIKKWVKKTHKRSRGIQKVAQQYQTSRKCKSKPKRGITSHLLQHLLSKCWQGCREKRTLMYCWWECKLVQSLWKTA